MTQMTDITGTLYEFIKNAYTTDHQSAKFRYDGDGLQLLTDHDTDIKDWTPNQVRAALEDLEATGEVKVCFATHSADFDVSAFPLESFRLFMDRSVRLDETPRPTLSLNEVTRLIKTDDRFCAALLEQIGSDLDTMSLTFYDYLDVGEGGMLDGGGIISERKVAIYRMPDEYGMPRLARIKQRVDELNKMFDRTALLTRLGLIEDGLYPIEFIEIEGYLWLLEDGLPSIDFWPARVEIFEALEKEGSLTLHRENRRVAVTSVFLRGEQNVEFQSLSLQ